MCQSSSPQSAACSSPQAGCSDVRVGQSSEATTTTTLANSGAALLLAVSLLAEACAALFLRISMVWSSLVLPAMGVVLASSKTGSSSPKPAEASASCGDSLSEGEEEEEVDWLYQADAGRAKRRYSVPRVRNLAVPRGKGGGPRTPSVFNPALGNQRGDGELLTVHNLEDGTVSTSRASDWAVQRSSIEEDYEAFDWVMGVGDAGNNASHAAA